MNSSQLFYQLQGLTPATQYRLLFTYRNNTFWETEIQTKGTSTISAPQPPSLSLYLSLLPPLGFPLLNIKLDPAESNFQFSPLPVKRFQRLVLAESWLSRMKWSFTCVWHIVVYSVDPEWNVTLTEYIALSLALLCSRFFCFILNLFESLLSSFPDTHKKSHSAFFSSLFPLKERRRCSRALRPRVGSLVSWVQLCCCCSSCSSSASSREAKVESIQASAGQQENIETSRFGVSFLELYSLASHSYWAWAFRVWKIWGCKFWGCSRERSQAVTGMCTTVDQINITRNEYKIALGINFPLKSHFDVHGGSKYN